MNDKLKTYLTSENKADTFAPYAKVDNQTLANYCETRFSGELDIHNKIICMKMIMQPYDGGEECLMLPENIDPETYHFSYFYKYMCLYMKKVEID